MKVSLSATGVLAVVAVVAVGYLAWRARKVASEVGAAAGTAAAAVGAAINPLAPTNIAYRGANVLGAAATGDTGFSLGSWIYDQFHPGEGERVVAPITIQRPAVRPEVLGPWAAPSVATGASFEELSSSELRIW